MRKKKLFFLCFCFFYALHVYSQNGFNPAKIPGLKLWLSADSGVTVNGSTVAEWADLSGNNNNATQGITDKQPEFVNGVSVLNSKPVLRFGKNGNSGDETTLTFPLVNISTNNLTAFLLYKPTGIVNYLQYILGGTAQGISTGGTAITNTMIFDGSNIMDEGVNPLAFNILTFNNDKIFRNGNQSATSGAPVASMHFNTIGARPDAIPFFYYGDIAEIVIYDKVLNDSLRTLVEHYLENKYAPPINLGPDILTCHPFSQRINKDYFTNYLWQDGSTADSSVITASGTYSVITTNIFNKVSYDSIKVIFDASDYSVKLYNDTTICSGQQLTLDAGSPHFSYIWSDGSTSNYIQVNSSGVYWVNVTDCNGGISSDTVHVKVQPLPEFTLGHDTLICYNSASLLDPGFINSTDLIFNWYDNTHDSIHSFNHSGKYFLNVVDTFACSFADTVRIQIDSSLFPVTLGPDISLCSGNFIGLISESAAIHDYLWSDGSTSSTLMINSSNEYKVTVTDINHCFKKDTINIAIAGLAPTADFSIASICEGDSTQFIDTSSPPSGNTITEWKWLFGDGNTSGKQHPKHFFADSGMYSISLEVTSNVGCTQTVSKIINIYPKPQALFGSQINCPGIGRNFIDSTNTFGYPISWKWTFDDPSSGETNISTFQNPTHQYNHPGIYNVKLIVQTMQGCIDSSIKLINVQSAISLISPSLIFPPNNSSMGTSLTFLWNNNSCATSSQLQIALDSAFVNTIVDQSGIINSQYNLISLSTERTHYWRIRYYDGVSHSLWSTTDSFLLISSLQAQNGFNPAKISGLKLWLSADTGITLNGSSVAGWADRSGNNNNATQSISGEQPEFMHGVSVLNGNPVLKFGKNGNLGDVTNLTFPTVNVSANNLTTFLLYKPTGVVNDLHYILGATGKGISTGGIAIAQTMMFDGSNIMAEEISPSAFNIVTFNNDKIFRNGNQSTTSGNPVGSMSFNTIGSRPDATQFFYYGDIAEVLIYDTLLNDLLRSLVEQYLENKYAPPVNLGPDTLACRSVTLYVKNDYLTSYLWQNGSTADSLVITNSGIYSVMATNIFDKISYDTINVTIDASNYLVHLVNDTTICKRQQLILNAGSPHLSYVWSNSSTSNYIHVNSSGLYWVDVTDCNGFVSTDTIHVNVTPLPEFNLGHDSLICYNSNSFLDPGFINSNGLIFNWFDNTHDSIHLFNHTGKYFLNVVDAFGCTFTDTVHLRVDSSLFTATLGPDVSLCSGNSIGLLSDGLIPVQNYLWSDASTNQQLAIKTTGQYWLQATNANGCIKQDTIHIDISGIAPTADFTSTNFCHGDSVEYTDISFATDGSTINQWNWGFGDGHFSTSQNTTHLFADTGIYNVNLKVITDVGCDQTISKTIRIYPNPQSDFGSKFYCSGLSTDFSDSTNAFGYTLSSRKWFFDDPSSGSRNSSTTKNPQHQFAGAGNYNVKLIAQTALGCVDSVSKTIIIKPTPLPGFSNTIACFGDSTVFTDTSIIAAPWTKLKGKWNFGDGISSIISTPSHLYSSTGTYIVTFSLTSSNGCQAALTKNVSVNAMPKAGFGYNNNCLNSPTSFSDSSFISNSNIVSRNWDFGHNTSSSLKNPSCIFADTGLYPVKLVVTSKAACMDSITKQVAIKPLPRSIFTLSSAAGNPPLTVDFTNVSTGATKYIWDFGDGSQGSAIRNPKHIYRDTGSFHISLLAMDEKNCKTSTSRSLRVIDAYLDISILNVKVDVDNSFVNLSADIYNSGTVKITSADIIARLEGGSSIRETWKGELILGSFVNYNFSASMQAIGDNYVCVEISNPNFSEDLFPENNEICISLKADEFIVPNPYPNPSFDKVNVVFILPEAGEVEISLFDWHGGQVMITPKINATKGLNQFTIETTNLNSGMYAYRVSYRDKALVRKFIKSNN